MTNQTEEITSFRPLTGWQKSKLLVLKHYDRAMLTIGIPVCILLVFYMTCKDFGLISWTISKGETLMVMGLMFASLVVSFTLAKEVRRAKQLLDIENQWIVCSLEERTSCSPGDGRRFYKTNILKPLTLSGARRAAQEDKQTLVSIVLPLRRGLPAEIYVTEDGQGPVKLQLKMRIETVEAYWSKTDLLTRVRLVDKAGSELETEISPALKRIYENRFRIEMFETINALMRSLENNLDEVTGAVKALRASLAQCEAERSTLVSAVADAVSSLSSYEKFCRSWAPTKEVGMALVRTMLACPPNKEDERTRVTVATEAFKRK